MAGHDYGYRSGYSNSKGGGLHPDEWSKTGYTDDECRTVIVDANGTQRIIYGCTPLHKPGNYVTKTETIVEEHVISPTFPAAYKHSYPPTTVEPVREYGYADDKWRRPSSPVKSYGYSADDHKLRRPSSPVKRHGYSTDDHKLRRPSSPVKGYGYSADDHKLRRPSSPVKGYGYPANDHKLYRPSSPVKGYGYPANDHKLLHRPSSPEHDYPLEVGDFLSKVQIEASRDQPSRIGPFNGVNRHQPPHQTEHNGTAGYGDYSDYNNKTFYKPNGNTNRNDNYDDYRGKNDTDMKPNKISNGGPKARPIPPVPSTLSPSPDREGRIMDREGRIVRLTTATDDIETALRYLKESAKSSSATTTKPPYSQYSAAPKQNVYPMDPAKRQVRFNGPSWP